MFCCFMIGNFIEISFQVLWIFGGNGYAYKECWYGPCLISRSNIWLFILCYAQFFSIMYHVDSYNSANIETVCGVQIICVLTSIFIPWVWCIELKFWFSLFWKLQLPWQCFCYSRALHIVNYLNACATFYPLMTHSRSLKKDFLVSI